MISETVCTHDIKIINFEKNDVVSFEFIRLLGVAETSQNQKCSNTDSNVTVHSDSSNNTVVVSTPLNKKFKILFQLQKGLNELRITFGCKSIRLNISFIPAQSEYIVQPLYVICKGHDGHFQSPSNEPNSIENARKRILLCSKLLQCFTAEKLHENGLGRKTFNLAEDCGRFESQIDYVRARKMDQEELWQHIGRDIMNSKLASKNTKYLAFLSCTYYDGNRYKKTMKSHQDLLEITEAYVALGGGGLALFGTACLYTWPETFSDIIPKFIDETPVDRNKFLDDSCYRGTLGACFSTTLGSVLHELYHTFDLGHTEHGIMGRGFDNIHKFFTTPDDTAENAEETSKRFQNQIEFKEEFEADKLSERLINENKKKECNVIRKFEDDDCTFLTKSCAVILCYHRWFNEKSNSTCTLTYDPSNNFIRSTAGIRVIELRTNTDEMIINDWTFTGKVLKFSFRLPDEAIRESDGLVLFVEDNAGITLKQKLKV